MITNSCILTLLRSFCSSHGGHHHFGFAAHAIGNKSLRSGAPMALFLANHPTAKIMLLGRWLSDAFLAYIRPQVLEWTNNMSLDMIHLKSFLDASFDLAGSTDPPTHTHPSKSILQWPRVSRGNPSVLPTQLIQWRDHFRRSFLSEQRKFHANTSTD
jgi:hypothetical protein